MKDIFLFIKQNLNNIKEIKLKKKIESLLELRDKILDSKEELNEIIKENPELLDLMHDEIENLNKEQNNLEEAIKNCFTEKEQYEKGIILEIRSGTGGKEASLFAKDLFNMYLAFCNKKNFKFEILFESSNEYGIKSCTIEIKKSGNLFSLEGGAHRVQRIPETEAKGRVHTSIVTVSILPLLDDLNIHINPKDLKIETCRSSGAGGQHVNTTDSAIRIVHLPTGIAVECQDERSQLKNKEKAMKELMVRIYQHEQKQREDNINEQRNNQIGSGERNEKFRTYNYNQNRVTDHRYNITIYNLMNFINGDMEEMLEKIHKAHEETQNIENTIENYFNL